MLKSLATSRTRKARALSEQILAPERAAALARSTDTLEAAIQELRGHLETPIQAARAALDQKRIAFELLAAALAEQAPAHYCDGVPDGIFARAEFEFRAIAQRLAEAERAKAVFKVRHGIAREPEAPNVLENALLFGLFIVVDGLINAGFFLNAHMTAGPVGALLASVLISLVNVSVCALAGYFIGRSLFYGTGAADGQD